MSSDDIEELMLDSLYEYFLSMISSIEKSSSYDINAQTMSNQMYHLFSEMLKDISIQTNLHLECYRSREKCLFVENGMLDNKKKAINEESDIIKTESL